MPIKDKLYHLYLRRWYFPYHTAKLVYFTTRANKESRLVAFTVALLNLHFKWVQVTIQYKGEKK
jgi:hypothetical protein